MNERLIKECCLVKVTEEQMLIRGGTTWQDILKLVEYIKVIVDFISEYKDDFTRGFKKGWRGV